ncbi:peptidase [Streptomyces sp. C11-1]|uniref:Peptidase n=1 Tax=Streptomyces durocortorensis TaxID=2811104 RepID=A0ABY9VTX5_9ACTN|nr:peptidase [Streptomyces durocortorensis]WNF27243.1 peptidase [Streptomyces durocortorensis]
MPPTSVSPTSCARLRDCRVLAALGMAAGIAVPAVLLGGPQAAALSAPATQVSLAAEAAALDEQPACGDPDAKEFPIETRIQGAPGTYASGGGYGTWFLELTNTTDASCRALHPVLVLADRDRRLAAEQIQLEFTEPGRPGAVHRAAWETTDHDEQIGVFGGERAGAARDSGDSDNAFRGLTVPAGKTVAVRVRMAFTSDTDPGPVTAHAAVVQRLHRDEAKGGGREDGDWVGESEEYPFVIVDGATDSVREPERPDPGRTGAGKEALPEAGDGDGGGRDGGKERPGLPPRDGAGRPLPELARTGPASLAWTGATAGALLLGGTALLAYARRSRRTAG